MTAVKISGLETTCELKENMLSSKKRRTTDRDGLNCLIALLSTWLVLWGYAIYLAANLVSPCEYAYQNTTSAPCANHAHINSSTNTINNLSVLINSTIHLLNTDQVSSDLYTRNAIAFIRMLTAGYLAAEYTLSIYKIIWKYCPLGISAYLLTVSAGKLIFTVVFTTAFFSKYSYFYNPPDEEISILYIPELCTFALSFGIIFLWTFIKCPEELSLKSAVRYYVNRRHLILYRLLNLIMMILLIAANVTLFRKLYTKDMFVLLSFISIGSIYAIFFLHNYGKLVTVAACANHDWTNEEKALPFKDLVYAMFMVGRYHLGTIFLNSLCVRRIFTLKNDHKLPMRDIMDHFGTNVDTALHSMEYSTILTAVHSQNFGEANTNIILFELEEAVTFGDMSISSMVWKDISSHYLFANAMVVYLSMSMQNNVEILIRRIMTIGVIFSIQCIYNYILTITDTIDFVIMYCEIEKEKNTRINDQEQSEATMTKEISEVFEN